MEVGDQGRTHIGVGRAKPDRTTPLWARPVDALHLLVEFSDFIYTLLRKAGYLDNGVLGGGLVRKKLEVGTLDEDLLGVSSFVIGWSLYTGRFARLFI